jgi:hypothetical protein
MLFCLPALSVGFILGIHFLLILPPTHKAAAQDLLAPLLTLVICHLVGNWIAIAWLVEFVWDHVRRIAVLAMVVGYAAGAYSAYRFLVALGY